MNTYLMLIICALALRSGRISAIIFAVVALAHAYGSGALTGWGYYLSAAGVDVAVMVAIAHGCKPSKTAGRFLHISAVSFFLNFYGWGLWLLYKSPLSYDIAFTGLYVVAALATLGKDAPQDAGRINLNFFPALWDKSHLVFRMLSGKAGN